MKRKKLIIMTCMSMLAATVFQANAQRTMNGQSAICADVSFNGMSAGITVDYSRYTLNGFWSAGISCNDYKARLSTGGILNGMFRYGHIGLCGGYMFRIAGTRDRSINLYGGGNIFIGAELADPFDKVPYHLAIPMGNGFLYGIAPEVMVEFFVSTRFAFTATGALPINFSSVAGAVNFNVGAGIKIML